jgi:1-aminocyclopropane-1-carboxylate deaminase/D-cysteine desulfhydrase-like pyridoxal-dependent ACC family enzyme
MAHEYTPVQHVDDYLLKRDDLFTIAGVCGGKARTCWHLAQGAAGLVTAGSRSSPQANIVASIAKELRIPCRIHTPQGELSPELRQAQLKGAHVIQHKSGYNNVIIKRALDDAAATGYTSIPFGMECDEAVKQTRMQVQDIPLTVERIVVACGSGMSLSGLLWGLNDGWEDVPVLAVQVGADPTKRLDKYAPKDWRKQVKLVKSHIPYSTPASPRDCFIGAGQDAVHLDPIYEAKCRQYLQPNDLFWIIGIRETADVSQRLK